MSPAVRASGVGALTSRADPESGLDAFRTCGSASGRASASLRCSSKGMMARSTKAFPTFFHRTYLTDRLNTDPALPIPTETMHEDRIPVAIKQARCLPPYSTTKLFVLNKLIPRSWNSFEEAVTKSYVFSRGVLADQALGADSPNP